MQKKGRSDKIWQSYDTICMLERYIVHQDMWFIVDFYLEVSRSDLVIPLFLSGVGFGSNQPAQFLSGENLENSIRILIRVLRVLSEVLEKFMSRVDLEP